MADLICEICMEVIGRFDPETLSAPFTSEQFTSKDPEHEFPPPFQPGLDWQWMKCPICKHRPFIQGDSVKTTNGIFRVGDAHLPRGASLQERNQDIIEALCAEEDAKEAELKREADFRDRLLSEAEKRQALIDAAIAELPEEEEPQFVCQKCGQAFETQAQLNGHSQVHRAKPRKKRGKK